MKEDKNENVTSIISEDSLIEKLKHDAELVDVTVKPETHQQLMAKIGAHQYTEDVKRASLFSSAKFVALAASVALVAVLMVYTNNTIETAPEVVSVEPQAPSQYANVELNESVSETEQLLSSNHLDAEYQAILADLSRVKEKLVAL